jgi:anaerobic ribonucleoside-triphosphate reductase activating protein
LNYHDIKVDDLNNGSGVRVTLFVSGCEHNCLECHNPQTHDANSGRLFDENAKNYIFEYLAKDYIDGITLSGGDPLYPTNVEDIFELVSEIKDKFHNKTIWLYTGYTLDIPNIFTSNKPNLLEKQRYNIIRLCDVVVDGNFVKSLADINYPYAGSTNQRVIDIQKSFFNQKLTLFDNTL